MNCTGNYTAVNTDTLIYVKLVSGMRAHCFHNGILLSGMHKFNRAAVVTKKTHIVDIFNECRFEQKKQGFDKNTVCIDVRGANIAPGFIDTHTHGFGGHGTDHLIEDSQSILKMAAMLPQHGVTSFLPTLYPKPKESMFTTLSACVENLETQKKLNVQKRGACIAGIHLEGPFISPGRLGIHHRKCSLSPNRAVMEKFIQLGKGHIRNMTVAPELKGMHDIALLGANHNIVLQAGHTDAQHENIIEGMQVGILHSTHFFNAMSRLHHRNPGTVGAILLAPTMSCEIIADGYHIHPLLVKLLMRNKSKENIVLVTDSLSPTFQKSGPFIANGEEVYMKDGMFYRKNDDVIAGSALTMKQGILNLVSWGLPLEHAVGMASYNPARILRIPRKGLLTPGYDADIVVFDDNMNIQYTVVEGSIVYTQKEKHESNYTSRL